MATHLRTLENTVYSWRNLEGIKLNKLALLLAVSDGRKEITYALSSRFLFLFFFLFLFSFMKGEIKTHPYPWKN